MIVLGRYSYKNNDSKFPISYEAPETKNLIVIPMKAIRFLTKISGFLNVDGANGAQFTDYDPTKFTAPGAQWTPPYPYHREDVLFTSARGQDERHGTLPMPPSM
jgi:hypothetical protein